MRSTEAKAKPTSRERTELHVEADPGLRNGPPPLLLLHGFTQDIRSWDQVREGLRRVGPTVAVDMIGHGASPKPEEINPYRMEASLDQLEGVMARLNLPKAWWVGYSMGGRVALNLAVNRPHLVAGLVLISTTAGIRDPEARAGRVKADAALAMRIPGWKMEDFIDYWLDLPLFQGLKRLPRGLQHTLRKQRLNNSPTGLANSLRGMGTGSMHPLWPFLPEITVPVLVMAGELDERFAAQARSMAAGIPDANLSILSDTGHSLHLEAPQKFLRTVIGYFNRQPG